MSDLLLKPHIYLGFTDGGAVFLDVKRDRYFGIGSPQLQALRAVVSGSTRNVEAEELAKRLLEQGLITLEPPGRRFVPETIEQPCGRVAERSFLERPNVSASHFINLSRSYLETKYLQKTGSFENSLTRARVRNGNTKLHDVSTAPDAARKLVEIFFYLRSIFYAPKNNCLLDSLVLLRFLSFYNLKATFIIGVATAPFAAHCWLQSGDRTLNARPEFAALFQPILTL